MKTLHPEVTKDQLLELMAVKHLAALNLGLLIKKNRQAAIAYASETSCAGSRAREIALSRWN